MPPRALIAFLTGLLLVVLSGGPASATTLHPFTEEELTWVAEAIVVGTVESMGSVLDGRHPHTHVRIRVEEVLKGEAARGSLLVVRELGGETPDGRFAFVPASPQFDVGERVLLFLEAAPVPGTFRCVGMFQGKYTLREDGRSGRQVAYRVHANAYTGTYDHRALPIPEGAREASALIERVRARVAAGEVPDYREIPGLPEARRRELRAYWGLDSGEEMP